MCHTSARYSLILHKVSCSTFCTENLKLGYAPISVVKYHGSHKGIYSMLYRRWGTPPPSLIKFGSSGLLPNRCYFLYFNKGILTPEFYARYHCHFFHWLAQLNAGGGQTLFKHCCWMPNTTNMHMEEARESSTPLIIARGVQSRKLTGTSGVDGGQEAPRPRIPELAALRSHPINTQSFFACQILVQPQFKSIYTRLSYFWAQMLAHTVCWPALNVTVRDQRLPASLVADSRETKVLNIRRDLNLPSIIHASKWWQWGST